MTVLFAINHPSQFHMFKNLAIRLQGDSHRCIFFIQERGIIERLAIHYGFEYKLLVSPCWRNKLHGRVGVFLRSIIHLIQAELRIVSFCLKNKVDYLLGTDIAIAHIGRLLSITSVLFTDDDYYFTKEYSRLAYPFAKYIFAPFVADLDRYENKKISYKGTQKTGYLHPLYFSADSDVLEKYDLKKHQYTIIRLVEYNALHDKVHKVECFLYNQLTSILPILLRIGKVVISCEKQTSSCYDKYCVNIDPEDMHSLMYFAKLMVVDSQSMHVEAGLLGTPSIRFNNWVDKVERVNVIDYLENMYGLGISVSPSDSNLLIEKIVALSKPGVKEAWLNKRDTFFAENTDFTDLVYRFIINYSNNEIDLGEFKNEDSSNYCRSEASVHKSSSNFKSNT